MFQSSAGDKPRPLVEFALFGQQFIVSILGRGQAPAARGKKRRTADSSLCFNPRPGTSPGRSLAGCVPHGHALLFQSSAGDKPRPLSPLNAFGCDAPSFNPRPGTSPGRSIIISVASVAVPEFQSSAGDKPRPLSDSDMTVFSLIVCFNPRPGTSPGRSVYGNQEAPGPEVSILGRGQAPAARCARRHHRWDERVSILGRGQAPAARNRFPDWAQWCGFQSSAGDKPRPLNASDTINLCYIMFQSSAGDKPRPLGQFDGRPIDGIEVSILGRGQAPAALPVKSTVPSSQSFQSSAGDKPRPLEKLTAAIAAELKFQSSAGDKPRPLLLRTRRRQA